MTEAVLEKETCSGCGVDIREDTLFCYNCGARVADEAPSIALDNAFEAANNGNSRDGSEKLAAAASERKRARVAHRQVAEYVWESTAGERASTILVIGILIVIFAFVVVLLMANW